MNERYRYFVIAALVAGSFIGIWHALPMLNVVADEAYYVGGVLRAMEARSILPLLYDVPYGTLTFYLSYILMLPFVFGLLAFKGFHFALLKTYLVLHPEIAYLVPRFLSGVLASVFVWRYERFLHREGLPLLQRFAVLSVPIMTTLPAIIFHTGKMWVLSMILVTGSMLSLYTALKRHAQGGSRDAAGAAFWSIVLACAAFANFPLAGLFLITIPVLLFAFRRDRALLRSTVIAGALGAAEILAIFAINYKNIFYEMGDVFTNYHPLIQSAQATPLHQIGFLASAFLHTQQIIVAFPLVLLLLVWALFRRAIPNKLVLYISLGYAALYVGVLMFLATWSGDAGSYFRYLFPLGFFLSGVVASLGLARLRTAFIIFSAAQVMAYVYVLYLLAVPTTFNLTRDYVINNFAQENVLVYNNVVELELPQNERSSALVQEAYCGSKCQYLRSASSSQDFAPTVVSYQSDLGNVNLKEFSKLYWIEGSALLADSCAGSTVASFQSGASDANFVSIEHNLGNYFLPDFWKLTRLGRNVYMYSVSAQCFTQLSSSR